jgi:phospholipid/cholesterol/gamma-HCH transport system substrate-binding protein
MIMPRTVRLGAFILGALLIFGAAIFMIGQKEFLFSPTYRLFAPFETVSGLVNGAEVRVGGVHVGTVDHINMPGKNETKVTVVMDLENSTRNVVKKDSVASILTEGLLGSKYVSISYGSKNAAQVDNGDTIRSEPPIDFSDIIAKSSAILDSTKTTMQNLESISQKVDRGQGTMGRLVNDKSIYENMNKTVSEAQAGVESFHENMSALKKNWFLRGFFKDRGYYDVSELTKYDVGKMPKAAVEKKFVYSSKDLFDEEKTGKIKEKNNLKDAGKFLQNNPFGLIVVTAYSGEPGEKEENLQMTQAQALVVRKFLIDNFKLDESRIKTKGFGEQTSNQKDEQQSCVEILVYGQGQNLRASSK